MIQSLLGFFLKCSAWKNPSFSLQTSLDLPEIEIVDFNPPKRVFGPALIN